MISETQSLNALLCCLSGQRLKAIAASAMAEKTLTEI
jgi:hypothetical protein